MLRVTVFEVGRGLSTLIELPSGDGRTKRVGIVDCYSGRDGRHPLLQRLRWIQTTGGDAETLQRTERAGGQGGVIIEFLVLTHLDADHFLGVGDLLREFDVRRLLDPGIDPNGIILAEYASDSDLDRRARDEIDVLRRFKRRNPGRVGSIAGPGVIVFEGDGARIRSVAPDGGFLGGLEEFLTRYVRRCRREYSRSGGREYRLKTPSRRRYDLNRSSSAVEILYGGRSLVIGGDVLSPVWHRLGGEWGQRPDVFVLSHHGSTTGFPWREWSASFHKRGAHAVVSGRGLHQPSRGVVDFLVRDGTRLVVTNVPGGVDGRKVVFDFISRAHYGSQPASRGQCSDVDICVGDDIRVVGIRLMDVGDAEDPRESGAEETGNGSGSGS